MKNFIENNKALRIAIIILLYLANLSTNDIPVTVVMVIATLYIVEPLIPSKND